MQNHVLYASWRCAKQVEAVSNLPSAHVTSPPAGPHFPHLVFNAFSSVRKTDAAAPCARVRAREIEKPLLPDRRERLAETPWMRGTDKEVSVPHEKCAAVTLLPQSTFAYLAEVCDLPGSGPQSLLLPVCKTLAHPLFAVRNKRACSVQRYAMRHTQRKRAIAPKPETQHLHTFVLDSDLDIGSVVTMMYQCLHFREQCSECLPSHVPSRSRELF